MGKHLQYKTVQALQEVIDEYFDYCENRTRKIYDEKRGVELMISYPAPYTMSGLARRIGLSRQALCEYSHREAYGDAIMRAREKVQEDVENRLMETKNEKGAMFNLKNNFGWKDKTEIEGSLGVTVSFDSSLKQDEG